MEPSPYAVVILGSKFIKAKHNRRTLTMLSSGYTGGREYNYYQVEMKLPETTGQVRNSDLPNALLGRDSASHETPPWAACWKIMKSAEELVSICNLPRCQRFGVTALSAKEAPPAE